MGNRIVITNETIQNRPYRVTALFAENRLAEVSLDAVGKRSLLGSVFVAKIRRILKDAGAAFVELSPGQAAYLPLADAKDPWMVRQSRAGKLTEGDEIVVQVVKEAVKTKEPTVSARIALAGVCLALTREHQQLGISRKLGKQEREYFRELFSERKAEGYGLVVRTSAKDCEEERLLQELETLNEQFSEMERQYRYRTCYSCLYHAPLGYIADVRNYLSLQPEQVVTDDEEVYRELKEAFAGTASLAEEKIVCYADPALSLSALYGLKTKLKAAFQERVWLKSGAYLIIQPTEALTVIDVNSGGCTGGREGLALKVNLEAAKEIAWQLRLRNISGICLVDFINMEHEEEKERLAHALKGYLAKDTVPAVFVDFTALGLAELTRKKVKKPLWEQLRAFT